MPMPLVDLLEGLLRSHGHTVSAEASLEGRSGAVYTIPLLAESSAHGNVLVTGDLDEGLDGASAQEFRDILDDTGADLGILVHGGDPTSLDDDVRDACAGRIVVWGRAELARALGDALLAQELGSQLAPLMLAPVEPAPSEAAVASDLGDLLPAAFRDLVPTPAPERVASTPPPEPELSALQSLDVLDLPLVQSSSVVAAQPPTLFPPLPSRPTPAPSPTFGGPAGSWTTPATPSAWPPATAPATASHVQPSSPGAMPSMVAPPIGAVATNLAPVAQPGSAPQVAATGVPARRTSRPLLPVRLSLDAAKRKVKDKLYGIQTVELVLHPVHLFDYELDDLQKGSLQYDTLDGRIQVHGADKSILDVDPDQANPDGQTLLPADHQYSMQERVIRIDAERAAQLAHEHVRKKHTRSVEVRVQDEDNSIYYTERRKVEPTPQQVRVKLVGTYFRAAWRLIGRNGQVDLDALDGRELFAEVRGGRSDTMMLD